MVTSICQFFDGTLHLYKPIVLLCGTLSIILTLKFFSCFDETGILQEKVKTVGKQCWKLWLLEQLFARPMKINNASLIFEVVLKALLSPSNYFVVGMSKVWTMLDRESWIYLWQKLGRTLRRKWNINTRAIIPFPVLSFTPNQASKTE